MIGGPNPISYKLNQIYRNNNKAMANSLARIASGKKMVNASDDFIGFLRSTELQNDIAAYRVVKQDIIEAKGLADYSSEVAEELVDDLERMKELAELYETEVGGGNDQDVLDAYESEYNALQTTVANLIDDSYYDGIKVVSAPAVRKSVDLDPTGANGVFTIQFAAGDIPDVSAINISDANADDDIQTEILAASTYLHKADGFSEDLQMHADLTDTIINSKEATSSLITDIEEIEELAELTDIQIRQQATIAMAAQANEIRYAIARLYGSNR